jgi:hypothetical protein
MKNGGPDVKKGRGVSYYRLKNLLKTGPGLIG